MANIYKAFKEDSANINVNYAELNRDEAVTTATLNHCEHLNGWYITVPFWIFKKKLFVCTDCGAALTGRAA